MSTEQETKAAAPLTLRPGEVPTWERYYSAALQALAIGGWVGIIDSGNVETPPLLAGVETAARYADGMILETRKRMGFGLCKCASLENEYVPAGEHKPSCPMSAP